MAILIAAAPSGTRPTTPSAPSSDPLGHSEATTWAIDLPATDVAAVRRAVVAALSPGSPWAKVRSLSHGRYRTVSPVETLLWAQQIVRTAEAVDNDLARAHALGAAPLEQLPFVVVVTPDAVVLRWHRRLGGHHDADLLLQQLVRAATQPSTGTRDTARRLLAIA